MTAEFYKRFSNKLALVLLDVHDSWGNLDPVDVSSGTGIISAIHKKRNKKYITHWKPISLLNFDYKVYTTILKNRMQKTLDTIISENQSAAIKNRTILHTLSIICEIGDVSNNLNKSLSVILLDFLKAFDRMD